MGHGWERHCSGPSRQNYAAHSLGGRWQISNMVSHCWASIFPLLSHSKQGDNMRALNLGRFAIASFPKPKFGLRYTQLFGHSGLC